MKKLLLFLLSLFFVSLTANYDDSDATTLLGINDDIDDELGAIAKANPSFASRIRFLRERRNHERKNAYLNANVTKGQALLVAKSSSMPPSLHQAFVSGNINFTDDILFYTKGAFSSLSGILTLVNSNDTIGTGYSNLKDGGIVPKNKAIAVDFIVLKRSEYVIANGIFDSAFTSTTNSAAFYSVQELEVLINDKTALRLPIGSLIENRIVKGSTSNNTTNTLGINLRRKLVIKEDDTLQFRIHTPSGITKTPTAGSAFAYRVELYGDATQTK